jgi:hypothetical protein
MIFVSMAFGVAFLVLLRLWFRELIFYRRHSWDFTKDSGLKGFGSGAEGSEPIHEFSSKTRVTLALPVMLIACLVLALVLFANS